MKTHASLFKSRTAPRLLSLVLISALLLPGGAAWAANQPPLKKIPVPVPRTQAELAAFPALTPFIKDVPSAIALGKALFWDMQVGSDGKTACATCHYRAGADPIDIRSRNQLNPGPGDVFQVLLSGPSSTLTTAEFPFFRVTPPTARLKIDPLTGVAADAAIITSITGTTTNDIAGSQGVLKTTFTGINPGNPVDSGTAVPDPIFNVGGQNVRQVTGRNSPSVINAVFNYANFWDGRANNIFNGVNPFGPADQGAQIWINDPVTGLTPTTVRIPNASLASQAVGPPNNSVEMAFAGRTFPELGRKMLSLTPLGLQTVALNDSVFSNVNGQNLTQGLNTNYRSMIQNAFVDDLWNNNGQTVPVNTVNGTVQFSQMEANFSLFWGLSIMLYEATLISDQTPFDRFAAGNQNAMSLSAQNGHTRFRSQCAVCHSGSELTNAAVGTASTIGSSVPDCLLAGGKTCNPPAFTTNTNHNLIIMDDTLVLGGLSDAGFMNLALRPMTEDGGRAGTAPFSNLLTTPTTSFPLSFTLLAQLQAQSLLPFETPSLNTPLLAASFASASSPTAVQGTFKTPGLRNVELNAPYFHNGSMFDLQQVIEFYARGGNFPNAENPTLANKMSGGIGSLRVQGGVEQQDMKAFLMSLTDERVRNELAPFDHPQLLIPSGDPADTMIERPATGGTAAPVTLQTFTMTTAPTTTQVIDIAIGGTVRDSTVNNDMVTVEVMVNGVPGWATVGPAPTIDKWSFAMSPAVGLKIGNNAVSVTASAPDDSITINAPFDLLPTALIFGAPLGGTNLTSANMTVGGFGVTHYRYSLDGGPLSAVTPTTTPITLTGLTDAIHTLSVVGIAVGEAVFAQPVNNATVARWTVKTVPPVLSLNPVGPLSRGATLTISGTVELGSGISIQTDTGALAGPVQFVGTDWSCQLSGLRKGTNNITVTARDIASNTTSAAAVVNAVFPDGSFKGAALPDITDAVTALRIAVNLMPHPAPGTADLIHGDVAPLENGVSVGDGTIGVDDALLILKKVVGLVNF